MTDKMGTKNYAKYDRTFMLAGSIFNSMQGKLKGEEDWLKVWNFAKKEVSGFVDELYSGSENQERAI